MPSSFRPQPDLHPQMEQALDKAIVSSTGSRRYAVTDGRLLEEQPGRYRYAFTLVNGSWDVSDGSDLQLTSADLAHPLPVELVSTAEEAVTIVVTRRLPARTLASAHLVRDRAFLLRMLKEALTRQSPPASLGLKLFGTLDCADEEAEASLLETIREVFPADEAQQLAIRRALWSDLLLILGPPGTGKTDVLAAIALLHATLFGYTVLIVSHTNIALDNAVLRLARFLRQLGQEDFVERNQLVRCGEPRLAELHSDAYRSVTFSSIVADSIWQSDQQYASLQAQRETARVHLAEQRAALPREAQAWQPQEAALEQQRGEAEQAQAQLEAHEQARLAPLRERLAHLLSQRAEQEQLKARARAEAEEAARLLRPLRRAYQGHWASYEAACQQLARMHRHHPLIRLVMGVWSGERKKDLEQNVRTGAIPLQRLADRMAPLQQRLADASHTARLAQQRREELAGVIAACQQQRDRCPDWWREQQAALSEQISALTQALAAGRTRLAEIEAAIASGEQEVALLEEALAHLDQQVIDAKRRVARRIIEEAQIVATTLTGLSLNPLLRDREWDVVILDEGSMAPPPAVLLAAERASHHLIVVGDPLQLPPVCPFEDQLVRHWLGRDVFSLGGYTLEQAAAGTHHCVLLPYQSRMHHDICDLVRGPVYRGQLKDRHPLAARPTFAPEPAHAVVLYDTSSSHRSRAQRPHSGWSRYNEYHAELDLHLVQQVLAGTPTSGRSPAFIGIVTPYTAQRDLLKARLGGLDLEPYCRVGTIHAFQGLEYDVLLFDVVDAPGLPLARFLCGGWESDAMRLLNVAVTRARHKLLIVAHLAFIGQQPAHFLLPQILHLAGQKKRLPA